MFIDDLIICSLIEFLALLNNYCPVFVFYLLLVYFPEIRICSYCAQLSIPFFLKTGADFRIRKFMS
jgi:hypothetical protein